MNIEIRRNKVDSVVWVEIREGPRTGGKARQWTDRFDSRGTEPCEVVSVGLKRI